MEECSGEVVVAKGVPLLFEGHTVGAEDWFKAPPSSSVRFKRSIEAIVVTIGSRTRVALRPMVSVTCGDGVVRVLIGLSRVLDRKDWV